MRPPPAPNNNNNNNKTVNRKDQRGAANSLRAGLRALRRAPLASFPARRQGSGLFLFLHLITTCFILTCIHPRNLSSGSHGKSLDTRKVLDWAGQGGARDREPADLNSSPVPTVSTALPAEPGLRAQSCPDRRGPTCHGQRQQGAGVPEEPSSGLGTTDLRSDVGETAPPILVPADSDQPPSSPAPATRSPGPGFLGLPESCL